MENMKPQKDWACAEMELWCADGYAVKAVRIYV